MLRQLRTKHFKSFRDTGDLRLGRLTLILGENSSGKSALVQPLLLLAQSIQAAPTPTTTVLELNGPMVELGHFKELVRNHDVRASIEIAFSVETRRWRSNVVEPDFARQSPRAWTPSVVSYKARLAYSSANDQISVPQLTYISSSDGIELRRRQDRVSWRHVPAYRNDSLALSDTQLGELLLPTSPVRALAASADRTRSPKEDEWRELVAFELSRAFGNVVFAELSRMTAIAPYRPAPQRFYFAAPTSQISLVDSGQDVASLARAAQTIPEATEFVATWLNRLGIASDFQTKPVTAGLLHMILTDNATGVRSNLADFGFGLSQVLPLLLSAASRRARNETGTVIIQQPEVHLHPAAQRELADLFVGMLSRSNSQVIIETHSEQIVRVIQRRVLDGTLSPDDVAILFVRKTSTGSTVDQISLDADGRLPRSLPLGFLDTGYLESLEYQKESANKVKA